MRQLWLHNGDQSGLLIMTQHANMLTGSPRSRAYVSHQHKLALANVVDHSQVRRSKRVLAVQQKSALERTSRVEGTYILQVGGLDLRVNVEPLEDLVPCHTLELHREARLATEDGDGGVVALVHERAEHRAG